MKSFPNKPKAPSHCASAFTIVELLVASAILIMMVALLFIMVNQTSTTWKATSGKIEQFRAARDAFDTITRRVSQATLNSYLDYVTNSSGVTVAYLRQSELRFISGPMTNFLTNLPTTNPGMCVFFQAPNGFNTNTNNSILQNALNSWGYFLEYGADTNNRPGFLTNSGPKVRFRYRLMEFMEPTESLSIYNYTTNRAYTGVEWITNSLGLTSNRPVHVLAENVIALILLPKLPTADWATNASHPNTTYVASSLCPNYSYDSSINQNSNLPLSQDQACLNSHNQLPPVMQVTLIAVDEASAIRFPAIYTNLASTFSRWFTNAASFTNDLTSCQNFLSSNKFNFRVFTTDVMVKGAKWSSSQTN